MDKNVLENLYGVIEDRRKNRVEGSYTNYLFDKGIDKMLKKIGEESAEVIISCKNTDNYETVKEISDLVYHVMVTMVEKGITLEEVEKELELRSEKICNKKPSLK
jgi:phosphoribosyl-ATP pyrophosphohydrolase